MSYVFGLLFFFLQYFFWKQSSQDVASRQKCWTHSGRSQFGSRAQCLCTVPSLVGTEPSVPLCFSGSSACSSVAWLSHVSTFSAKLLWHWLPVLLGSIFPPQLSCYYCFCLQFEIPILLLRLVLRGSNWHLQENHPFFLLFSTFELQLLH